MNVDSDLGVNTLLLDEMVGLLGEVAVDLVFVGGCATGLLVTSSRAQGVRVTTDVDAVSEATTITQYHALEKRLRAKGFRHDPDVICRWRVAGLQLDVMPSGPNVLGFHNRWYPIVAETASPYLLPSGRSIRLITSPLFLATKLEAFQDRGAGDYLASHDLEDIVTVVDGRAELLEEVGGANEVVRVYLRERLSALLVIDAFVDALPGHLSGDAASQARVPIILERLRRLATAT